MRERKDLFMNNTKRVVFIFLLAWVMVVFILTYKHNACSCMKLSNKKYRIGLLIMATGRYVHLANKLIESAQKYFCKHNDVTYFVFTDGELIKAPNIVKIPQEQLGWPYDTMMRFHTYYKSKDRLAHMDYLFSCDADMLFVDDVGDEILGDLVAVRHSQLMFKRGIYDTNPLSTACVNRHEGKYYFVGAFYGGKREQFFKLLCMICENITTDLARGVIARVHDESHLNRYFIDNEPTVILSPSYCHFEAWCSPYTKKLIAFDRPEHYDYKVRKKECVSPVAYLQKMIKEKEVVI